MTKSETFYRVTLHRDGRKWFALLTYSRPGDLADGPGALEGIEHYDADGRRWYRFGSYRSRSARRALLRAHRAADRLRADQAKAQRRAMTFEEEFAIPRDRPYVSPGPK